MRALFRRSWRLIGSVLVLVAGISVANALWSTPDTAGAAPKVEAVEIEVDEAVGRLSHAIRFRTISKSPGVPVDPQSFLEFRAFLETAYPRVHETLEREIVNDFSLLYRWPGSDPDAKPILLLAHQDVVPPNGTWSKPPFDGLIEDGYIWGRGSLDDKVSILGILEAVELLLGVGFEPTRTIYLAFGHDEEIDGRNGAQAMAALFEDRGIRFAFALDEGSPIGIGLVPGLDRPVALIGTSEKGYLSVELTANTTGGHSSIPSRASAMRVLGEALIKLWEEGDRSRLEPPFSQTLDALTPHFGFGPRLILANRWLFDPLIRMLLETVPEAQAMITTTAAVTIMEAGDKDNVLPSTARAVINHRLRPGTTVEEMLARVRDIVDDPAITIRQLGEANNPSPVADPSSDSFQIVQRTVQQVFPDVLMAPALVIAATDARHYVGVADQVYRFLPTRLTATDLPRMHGVDERLAIENYEEIIQFYVQLFRNGHDFGAAN
jgi:carboxypeptidase PM20D1